MSSPPAKRLKVIDGSHISQTKLQSVFDGLHLLLIEDGIGKARATIFQKQLLKHGAHVEKQLTTSNTHILVSKKLKKDKMLKLLKLNDLTTDMNVVDVEWLSECLVKGCQVPDEPYKMFQESLKNEEGQKEIPKQIKQDGIMKFQGNVKSSTLTSPAKPSISTKVTHTTTTTHSTTVAHSTSTSSAYEELLNIKNSVTDSSDVTDSTDEEDAPALLQHHSEDKGAKKDLPSKKLAGMWACAIPSSSKGVNHNTAITDKLAILEKNYTSTQERWRAVAYKKAITSIKNYHKPLETYEEVSSLPFVGDRLAQKIWEIIETGHLRRLDHIDPKVELMNKFSGVWGAGPKTAEQWVAQGFTSLEELQEKADLNFQQKIGVAYYNDINERMPREEVAQIEKMIRETAEEILPNVLVVVCGSYRRGRSTCGDIDLLVSHPDNKSHQGFLLTLLEALKEKQLITHDLITVQKEEQRKYMGLIKLPTQHSKHRRIDFIVTPFEEWPCALMHFTGSAHFNRSIRLLAKKKNMSLSEHALCKDVVRNNKSDEKLHKGSIIAVKSEEDIFRELGLDYLNPRDRDW